MQSQQCDFFRWYDREYTDYQLNYVNALRNEVYELRHERDAALYQAGVSSAKSDIRASEYEAMKQAVQDQSKEMDEMRRQINAQTYEIHELMTENGRLKADNDNLTQENGLLMITIDDLKAMLPKTTVTSEPPTRAQDMYFIAAGIGVAGVIALYAMHK